MFNFRRLNMSKVLLEPSRGHVLRIFCDSTFFLFVMVSRSVGASSHSIMVFARYNVFGAPLSMQISLCHMDRPFCITVHHPTLRRLNPRLSSSPKEICTPCNGHLMKSDFRTRRTRHCHQYFSILAESLTIPYICLALFNSF